MKQNLVLLICFAFALQAQAQTQSSAPVADSKSKEDTSSKTDTLRKEPDTGSNEKEENIAYGIASFYSKNLEGTKTSTGETFHHNKMTAASNHFKLNTWVRVTNLRNGKTVIVRINDRMHKKMALRGRVVDLSLSAAEKLAFIKSGLVRVKVVAVPKGTLQ